jgi:Nif-specific regulatory protein
MLGVLERELGFRHGTIMLTSVDGRRLTIEAVGDGNMNAEVGYDCGEGITGQVLKKGETAVVPTLADEPRFKNRVHRRRNSDKSRSAFVCVPIILDGETIGTLSEDIPHDSMNLGEAERVLMIVAGIVAHDISRRRMWHVERQALEEENIRLRQRLGDRYHPSNMVANSKQMEEVFTRIHLVASQNTTVLIRGESGTGKELVASAIHYGSPRSQCPFVKVNCAALTETLLESELFGHEKGAFTGATSSRRGRLEEADGGTLFLDELGDFSPTVQLKLLRVLQEREFQRVGGNHTIKGDVRIIAATNKNLEKLVADGALRQDFYYRINVFNIAIPPLRNRRSDILPLANHFIAKFSEAMGKEVKRISTPAIQMLTAYHWPGNVRELENCMEHAVLLTQDAVIHGRDLPPTLQTPEKSEIRSGGDLRTRVEMLERDMIVDALKSNKGNISGAGRELGISGRMVRYKIENLGIPYERLFPRRSKRRRTGKDE